MSVDPLAFLDQPESASEGGTDPLAFLDQSTSALRKPARHAAQATKGALNLNPAVASYNLATTLVREGAHKSRVRVSEQAKKDLQRMDEKLAKGEPLTRMEKRHYDRTKELSERKSEKSADISTEGLINRSVKAATGVDLEPEDLGEEITNIAASVINPSKAASNIQKIPKLFSKTGRAALSAERAAAKTKAGWDALGKAFKKDPERQGIVNWAQQNGLTPREATMLTQSEGRISGFGRAAKKTKQLEKDVKGLHQKLGAKYNELKEIGRKGGYLSSKQLSPLVDDLGTLRTDIGKTLVEGPETNAAIKMLDKAIFKIEHEGATIEDLIRTRQNLNQQINWNNVGSGGAVVGKTKESMLKVIENANPAVGRELRLTDKGWKTYEEFQKVLDKKQAFININGVPMPTAHLVFEGAFGAGVAIKALVSSNPVAAAKYYAIKEGIQRFSTAMITNPKLQGIHRRLVKAVISGDEERQRKLMVAAQKILKKDDPDLYAELGFKD